MKSHLAKVSLALLSAAFLLGCQEQGSEPVGPEGTGIQAKPGNGMGMGGGGGGDEATFTATWTGGVITGDPIVLLGGGPNLQTESGNPGVPATVDLSFFEAAPSGGGYTATQGAACFGLGDGKFTASFSIIVKKNDLKNVTANFAAFTAKSNDGKIDVNYGLFLIGVITNDNDWPPENSNTITWKRFEMIHQGGPGRNVGCFGTGSLSSVMKVTRN